MKTEAWQYRTVFIATPMYGGTCYGAYTDSMMQLATLAVQRGVQMKYYPLFNASHIDVARNMCADEFMKSDCTHMLFVDADIQFRAQDVLKLLELADPTSDKDVICGMYPKKCINWKKIVAAVKAGYADKNPVVLEHFVGDMVFTPALNNEAYKQQSINDMIEVHEAGSGFMMIQRRVLDKIRNVFPELDYSRSTDPHDGTVTCFFDGKIDPGKQPYKRFLTEDFDFCRLVHKVGMKIWLAPWMKLTHHGYTRFIGDIEALAAVEDRSKVAA